MKNHDSLIEKLRGIFVTQDSFIDFKQYFDLRMTPIERIVYGGVALILTSFLGAVVVYFIRKP